MFDADLSTDLRGGAGAGWLGKFTTVTVHPPGLITIGRLVASSIYI